MERKGEPLFHGYSVSDWGDREVLETDSGNECTTLWKHLMPLKLTFENGHNDKFCYISFIIMKKINIAIYQKTTELVTWSGWTVQYLNYISIKIKKKKKPGGILCLQLC